MGRRQGSIIWGLALGFGYNDSSGVRMVRFRRI